MYKFSDVFEFQNKSKIKAGDGRSDGKYPFYTSSGDLTKYVDNPLFDGEGLIFGTGGDASVHYAQGKYSVSTDCLVVKSKEENVNPKFIYYYLSGNIHILKKGFKGAGLKHISKDYISKISLPEFSCEIQNYIVQALDNAVSISKKRKEQLGYLDTYLRSVFSEMFGDPVRNNKKWKINNIRDVSEKISDGPFGSNLKTEHYQAAGVRVIRLKNIGLGEFKDENKAYISETHYETIRKHTCRPGDVLIATMGDPNIRACTLPKHIPIAINKADCVQFRPKKEVITEEYVCALLNSSSAAYLISKFLHGQTRTRVSMGQLSRLDIPVPPLELQDKFAKIVSQVKVLKETMDDSLDEMDSQFNALIQKAFDKG